MKLNPRPADLENDTALLRDFLTGRQYWQTLPPYWNSGKSRMALYLTMYEGKNTSHILWEDEAGTIHGYTYLSPDIKTPIYSTPELREWRVLLHPEHRTKEWVGRLPGDRNSEPAPALPIPHSEVLKGQGNGRSMMSAG